MPKKGFSVITVPTETKVEVEKRAEKNQESMADVIKRLLDLEATQ